MEELVDESSNDAGFFNIGDVFKLVLFELLGTDNTGGRRGRTIDNRSYHDRKAVHQG
jgi:hypothetical protein